MESRTPMRTHGFKCRKFNFGLVVYFRSKPGTNLKGKDNALYREKRKPVSDDALGSDAPFDADFSGRMPALAEYLTVPSGGEGKRAETATLTVFCEDGRFKLCLNDRSDQLVCFVSAESFSGALEELERVLSDGSADWRKAKGKKGKNS